MTYESTYEAVSALHNSKSGWDKVRVGSKDGLNVAEESIGRHSDSNMTAVRISDFRTGESHEYTFRKLNKVSNRVANYLSTHIERGDRVAAMLPARIELYSAIFGTIKSGRIYVPLAPIFGPDAVRYRLKDSGARILFATTDNLESVPAQDLPKLDRIVVVDSNYSGESIKGTTVVHYDEVASQSSSFETAQTHPSDIYNLKYTSGTTGQPKGIPTRHRRMTMSGGFSEYVIDLRPEDNYFVAASPAWSYGLGTTISAGIWDTGISTYRGKFDPEAFLETLEAFSVTNLMAPPTALRQVRSANLDPLSYDFNIRVLVSAGEALDERSVEWCAEKFDTRPLDSYGQTEAGMILANYSFSDWEIKAGSVGKPLPGKRVALLDESGEKVSDGEVGEIAVRRGDISVDGSRIYWGKPHETVREFHGTWYRTGDLARRDDDGYFWYVGRKDEVIISAGYRIGPEEVQETLLKHNAVSEAGVVGEDHETRGNIVKAYVTCADGYRKSDDLRDEIINFAKEKLSKHEYPREVEFVDNLPKTSSGKIKRRELS